MNKTVQAIVVGISVLLHFGIVFLHGSAHGELGIGLPELKLLFVLVIIKAAPIAAAIFVWTRLSVLGLWILFISMTGALLFGAYHHFVMISPDNIAHLPGTPTEHHATFTWTAGAMALVEFFGSVMAAYLLGVNSSTHRIPKTIPTSRFHDLGRFYSQL